MKAATLCSGIGAPEVAMPHWDWTFQSEIEDAPRQVLKYRHHAQDARYPRSAGPALWGDFTTIRVRHLRRLGIELPEWLIAGTPCQAFSLTGMRKSLSDDRGNLTMEFVRLVHSLRRAGSLRGIVWENVPGVLSTPDNAFGCFLGGLVGHGDALLPCEKPPAGRSNAQWSWRPARRDPVLDEEGEETGQFVERPAEHVCRWPDAGMVAGAWARVAWRVLDAQHFGVPQRRARVFLVASFVDGADPAAILFERRGLRGNPAKGRKKGEVAPTLPSRGSAGGGLGTDFDCDGGLIVGALTADAFTGGAGGRPEGAAAGHFLPAVVHTLRGEGFDASEDGSGRGTPLVPVVMAHGQAGAEIAFDASPTLTCNHEAPICFTAKDYGADALEDCAPVLRSGNHDGSHQNGGVMPAIACSIMPMNSGKDFKARETDVAQPLMAGGPVSGNQGGDYIVQPVALSMRGREGGNMPEVTGDVTGALRAASGGSSNPFVAAQYGVRRLMPVECERLQGFEDDFTLVPNSRGKPMADGPRYKMLGNSKAVPAIRWVLQRVEANAS